MLKQLFTALAIVVILGSALPRADAHEWQHWHHEHQGRAPGWGPVPYSQYPSIMPYNGYGQGQPAYNNGSGYVNPGQAFLGGLLGELGVRTADALLSNALTPNASYNY